MIEGIVQDLRHGARMLVKNPGFTLIAIASIAIGVGANAAMFSLADGLVLRPLPVPRADQVVSVSATAPRASETFFLNNNRISHLDYVDLRDRAQTFAGLAAYNVTFASFATGRDQIAQSKLGLAVSGNFFDVLELQPALGRAIRPDEDIGARKRRRRRARLRYVDRAVRIRSGRHRAADPTRWSRLHRRRRGAADVHRYASGSSARRSSFPSPCRRGSRALRPPR